MHPLRWLASLALLAFAALTLSACSTTDFSVGSNQDVMGGVPPGADVMKERARGR